MYRVGFGDFFLVSFRDEGGSQVHVIIDCGVFKGTSQTGDIGSIAAAVADMVKETDKQVALIIMTHRHADHIAGFARCKDDFAGLTVGGVWMPIWESEFDPTAAKFQADLTRTAVALQNHFTQACAQAAAPPEELNTARKYMENATGLDAAAAAAAGAGGAGAGGANAVALTLLKKGLKVAPEYYQGGDPPKLPKALADIGVTAQILGPPPVADLDLMKLMDLKKGVGQYLTDASLSGDDERPPFPGSWEVEAYSAEPAYSPEAIREWVQPRLWKKVTLDQARAAESLMQSTLQSSQSVAALIAAKTLNSFLNNQSLVVLFNYKGKKLLFVGDAQAGNWEHWLFQSDKPDQVGTGALSSGAQQILSSVDFYKVGHHGSSNATPKVVAEALMANSHIPACMCSTQKGVYGTEDPDDPTKGTEVPRDPLLAELSSHGAFVRSDQIAIEPAGAKAVPAAVPQNLPPDRPGRRFRPGEIWVDCFM